MTDCFALLDEPRQPWLEPERLKEKFLARSAQFHPDRVHTAGEEERRAAQARYTELNAAYQCLREPRDRLRHLLELELQARLDHVQRIPAELMDFSMRVAQVCREADRFLAEKARTTSALLQVQLFERGEEWRDRLASLKRELDARNAGLVARLKALDADWQPSEDVSRRGPALKELESVYQLMSYCNRWENQVRERLVQLSL